MAKTTNAQGGEPKTAATVTATGASPAPKLTKDQMLKNLRQMVWNAATRLVHGGHLTSVQFKAYTLGTLFYRFVSERIEREGDSILARYGDERRYAELDDAFADEARETIVQNLGYYLRPSELFRAVTARARQDANLNRTLAEVFLNFEASARDTASEGDVKGLFANFQPNDPSLGKDQTERNALLCDLLENIRDLRFDDFIALGLDVFGLCYEQLIQMYALNSGTSGGEFYTPAEVSHLVALLAAAGRKSVRRVYDPACGSGSLLLNFNLVLGAKNIREGFFGQEINNETYNLCRMNMFLHGVNYDRFEIVCADTLLAPGHKEQKPFDAIVSNPPYSTPWTGSADPTLINDERFAPAGVLAPNSKADFAFVMHILSWLAADGTAAIVEFPGALYRGGAEQKIRQYLVKNNYVDTIIQLPANMFFGVSIATCIIVLKKNKADTDLMFIDATNEFEHVGNKNRLSDANIERIYAAHLARTDEEHFCRRVAAAEVEAEGYNLSVSTYVTQPDTREAVDIRALNQQISAITERTNRLRAEIDAIVAELEEGEA